MSLLLQWSSGWVHAYVSRFIVDINRFSWTNSETFKLTLHWIPRTAHSKKSFLQIVKHYFIKYLYKTSFVLRIVDIINPQTSNEKFAALLRLNLLLYRFVPKHVAQIYHKYSLHVFLPIVLKFTFLILNFLKPF